jgi:protein involved in polysaccharide export with SLBB domain
MWSFVVNTHTSALRRGIALGLAMCVTFPSLAVAQPPPAPGPTVAPPSPSAPAAVPADSILLRFGGVRPDACAGVNFGVGNVGRISLPPDYRIGPGDQIEVQLAGRLEVVRQGVVVDPEGNISLPPVGQVPVNRLTVVEAQRKVNEQLRGLFRFTDATLSIGVPRCFEVVLTGEVERPGSTQASAMRRIHEVILLSGGVTSRGSVRYVDLISRIGPPRTIDLLRFELLGDLSQNPLVEEGLRIHVPPRAGYVTLSGAVRRPGTYELSPRKSLGELLDLMGGVSQGAAASQARLTRTGPDGRNDTFGVDLPQVLKPPADVTLRPGDVLYVPPGVVLQDLVEVRGAFNGTADSAKTTTTGKPTIVQRLELAQGDRIRDLLVKAGGPSPLADLRLAVVERSGSGGPRRQIPIDLQRLLVEKEEYQNIALENGDVFILPPVEDKVYVLGEVRSPGPQDFRAGLTVREYLALAGGPTVRARFKNAIVTFRDGRTFKVDEAPPVEPGAVVSIPEVSVRWYQDYVSILSAVAGIVTTYAGLYLLFGGRITTTGQ